MKRLPMRKIREALRLRADGFSGRQVAQSLAVGRATISEYFRRADGWSIALSRGHPALAAAGTQEPI